MNHPPQPPRQGQARQVSDTPFARVLTAFMWSKTPPWSAAKTAAVLGIHRTRVANWCFHGIVPELDVMMSVMARLNIPMRFLIEAYQAAGMPAPPLDVTPEQAEAERAQRQATLGPAAARYYGGGRAGTGYDYEAAEEDEQLPSPTSAIPPARRGRGGGRYHSAGTVGTASATGATGATESTQPQQGQLPIEQPQAQPTAQPTTQPTAQETRDAEWEKMLAHTREVMALAGMGETAIEALLSNLKDTRDGKPTEAQRRIAEEHQSSRPSRPSSARSSQSSQSSQSSARAGQAGDEKPRQRPASPENSAYLPTER